MDNFNDIMAVVNSSEHVKEIESNIRSVQAHEHAVLRAALLLALLVEIVEPLVLGVELVSQGALGVVLRDKIQAVFVRIVNDLVKVYNVGVLQLL